MTTSVNQTLTQIENQFKTMVIDNAIKAELVALYANPQTAWLAIWPIKPLFEGVIKILIDSLYKKVTLLVDIGAIKLMNAQAESAWTTATLKLQVIAIEKGRDSNEYQEALKAEALAYSSFVRFNQ